MTVADTLRDLLAQPELYVLNVCYDPLNVRLHREAGIPMAFMGGFGVAAGRFGLPDVGLITFNDMLDQARNICTANPGYPIIADGDTGYGNAMNVRRTVIEYARAGVACILIEDQVHPKKCGHITGPRTVIPRDEARMKIRAAVEARQDADILIFARTDARGGHGFEEALARAHDFEDEGADIVFIEALETEDEMARFAGEMEAATWANMMPKTPVVDRKVLKEMGFRIVTYNTLLAASIKAQQQALEAMVAGDASKAPPEVNFNEMLSVVGLPQFTEMEMRYKLAE